MTSRATLQFVTVELKFSLDVEDGWPPVAVEGLPFTKIDDTYRLETSPLFVKDLSVGDVIAPIFDENGFISTWVYKKKSNRTTIWLLRIADGGNIEKVLAQLRTLDCNTVQLPQYGCFSIDVPAECPISTIDSCLEQLDRERVAIAYPSYRHE
jgi:hypothetical protein